MPHTLTETIAFATTVSVPDDGDGATAASIESPIHVLANRTQSLRADTRNSGVYRIVEVADTTALKAVTGMLTSDLRHVPGYGTFRFDSAVTPVGDTLPWIVKPSSGGGQWVHDLNAVQATYLATLATGKVVQPVPNRIVGAYNTGTAWVPGVPGSVVDSSAAGAFVDSMVMQQISGVAVGDIFLATVTATLGATGASGLAEARVAYWQGGSSTQFSETALVLGTTPQTISWSVLKTISTSAGLGDPHRILIQLLGYGGYTATIYSPAVVQIIHLRP